MAEKVPPLEEGSYTLGLKSSHCQEEPRIPDKTRKNEMLQLYYPLLRLGEDRDCEKLKETKEAAKAENPHDKVGYKEQMFRPHKCVSQNVTMKKLLKMSILFGNLSSFKNQK